MFAYTTNVNANTKCMCGIGACTLKSRTHMCKFRTMSAHTSMHLWAMLRGYDMYMYGVYMFMIVFVHELLHVVCSLELFDCMIEICTSFDHLYVCLFAWL